MGRWNRTHAALRQAALELFTRHGYDATSTAQVAELAGVSEMTLFRHFSTKESLLLTDPFDPLMADAVRKRPGHEPAMQALLEGIRESWSQLDAEDTQALRDLLRLVARTPSLRGAIERNSDGTAATLRNALTDRGVSETQAHVAASAIIAGLSAALLDWAQAEQSSLNTAVTHALDTLAGR